MTWFARRGIELIPSDLTGYPGWLQDMAQAHLNLLIIHIPRDVSEMLEYAESDAYPRLAEQAASLGIDVEWAPHALRDLLPREHFAAHPEWFRMSLLGERVTDWNMCVSSTDALEIVRENAARLASKLRPTTHRYYFWSDDGRPWCQCSQCAQLCPADQNMLFTNAVLEGIKTVDPQVQLSGLAYLDTLQPLEQVAPADGVFLEYAPIRRSFRYALDDSGCAVNRDELVKLERLLPSYGNNRAQAQVLEYWLDGSLFWRLAGRPDTVPRLPFSMEVLQRDLQLYAEKGFRSIVSYAVLLGKEYRSQHGQVPLQEYGEALLAVAGPQDSA